MHEPFSPIGNSEEEQLTGEITDYGNNVNEDDCKVKEEEMAMEKHNNNDDAVTAQPVASQRSKQLSKSKNSKKRRERTVGNSLNETSATEEVGRLLTEQADLSVQNYQEMEGHKFWDTQPVPKQHIHGEDEVEKGSKGPIEVMSLDAVRTEMYPLPAGFLWCEVNVLSDSEAQELYALLSANYVEYILLTPTNPYVKDDECMFRFNYSIDFLRWALAGHGYNQELHIGVRNERNGKLLGFISGVPAVLSIEKEVVRVVEVNFLCVHKKLRNKRLAPVLIKELTRRVNLGGVWQAVYTGGIVIPTPIASSRYYHRNLKPKKLIEVGFSALGARMTMARTIKLYKLPGNPPCQRIRQMEECHIQSAHELLMEYLQHFPVHPIFDVEEFRHFMSPKEGVINSFVVLDDDDKVTDFCSFFYLPSTIFGSNKYKTLCAAYSYYNVATSMSLTELMRNALVLARNVDMDVFNALNIMENEQFLEPLLFRRGDGKLQYYIFNWRVSKEFDPEANIFNNGSPIHCTNTLRV